MRPVIEFRAAPPQAGELAGAVRAVMGAKRPVSLRRRSRYGGACGLCAGLPSVTASRLRDAGGQTPALQDHPLQLGSVGVTGSPASNALASSRFDPRRGHPLQDFTTDQFALHQGPAGFNVNPFDATRRVGSRCRPTHGLAWRRSPRRCRTGRPRPRGPNGPKPRPPHGAPRRILSPGAAIWPPGNCPTTVRSSEPCSAPARSPPPPTSWSAPPARFPPSCTSSGGPDRGHHMEYGYSCMGYET